MAQDPESPRPERIDWSKLEVPTIWVSPDLLLREIVDHGKLQKILTAQIDFRIEMAQREIEYMKKIRDIIEE